MRHGYSRAQYRHQPAVSAAKQGMRRCTISKDAASQPKTAHITTSHKSISEWRDGQKAQAHDAAPATEPIIRTIRNNGRHARSCIAAPSNCKSTVLQNELPTHHHHTHATLATRVQPACIQSKHTTPGSHHRIGQQLRQPTCRFHVGSQSYHMLQAPSPPPHCASESKRYVLWVPTSVKLPRCCSMGLLSDWSAPARPMLQHLMSCHMQHSPKDPAPEPQGDSDTHQHQNMNKRRRKTTILPISCPARTNQVDPTATPTAPCKLRQHANTSVLHCRSGAGCKMGSNRPNIEPRIILLMPC